MLPSVQGFCRNGKIELDEPVPHGAEGRVIITFLNTGALDLKDRQISPEQAADLRSRLSTFAEDWNDPAMDSYDAI